MRRRRAISLAEILTAAMVLDSITDRGRLGLGLDIATTEKETSNPSALALIEQVGVNYFARLVLRWKTADDQVTLAILTRILDILAPRRVRRLCVDATSERFFAARVRRELAGRCPVSLIVSSESTTYLGEEMNFKQYLGNLLINTLEDNHLALADETWLKDDIRLVKRDRGTFVAEVDSDGNHGDAFDAIKLGLHALIGKGGPASADAAAVGTLGGAGRPRPGLRNPFARLFGKKGYNLHV